MRRIVHAFPLLAIFLAAALPGVVGLAGCSPRVSGSAHNPGDPGGPFHLTDQNGRAVDEKVLNGKWSVVFFGYTFCPDYCPTTLAALGQAFDQLGPKAAGAQVVFITVDPERDTPAQLKSYLSAKVFPKQLVGLTGTPQQIAQVAKAYMIYYQKQGTGANYSMDHSTVLYLMDPTGRFHSVLPPGVTPDETARRLSDAMRGDG
jgi:protein SCO1/2